MSRHVDLIAVAAILVVVALAARVHAVIQLNAGPSHMFRIRALHPIVIVPPHSPAVPHVPNFPRVQF